MTMSPRLIAGLLVFLGTNLIVAVATAAECEVAVRGSWDCTAIPSNCDEAVVTAAKGSEWNTAMRCYTKIAVVKGDIEVTEVPFVQFPRLRRVEVSTLSLQITNALCYA